MKGFRGIFSGLVGLSYLFGSVGAWANPVFDHTEAGSVTVQESGGVYDIYSADRSIGAFQSFSNVAGETINSIQGAADNTVLFRVIGAEPSSIFGNLNANSHVFLVNPNGILFGPGSQVNAPGLVASALQMSDADFLAGQYRFEATPLAGTLLNQGTLSAGRGGYVALLGSAVQNEGTVQAPEGSVVLGAGNAATLTIDGQGLVSVKIDKPIQADVYDRNGNRVNDAISNSGTLQADGGQVFLSAQAAEEVFDNTINLTGITQALEVQENNGVVSLVSDGDIRTTGTLSTDFLYERGGSFLIGGDVHLSLSDLENLDGALNLATGTYNNTTFSDPGDIIVNAGAVVTFTGTANLIDAGGNFSLLAGSTVTGAGATLDVDVSVNFNITGGDGVNAAGGGANGGNTSFVAGATGTVFVGGDLNIKGGAGGSADANTGTAGTGGSATFTQGGGLVLINGDLNLNGGAGGSANGGAGTVGTVGGNGGAGAQGIPESSGATGTAGTAGINGSNGVPGGVGRAGGDATYIGNAQTLIMQDFNAIAGAGGSAIGGAGAAGRNGGAGGNGGNGGSSGNGGAGGVGGKGGNGGLGGAAGTAGAGGAAHLVDGTGPIFHTGTSINLSAGLAGSSAVGSNGAAGSVGANGTPGAPLIGLGGAGGLGGANGTGGTGGGSGAAGAAGVLTVNTTKLIFLPPPINNNTAGLTIDDGRIAGGDGIDDFTAATSTLYGDEGLPASDESSEDKEEDPTGTVSPETVTPPAADQSVENETPVDTPIDVNTFSPCGA